MDFLSQNNIVLIIFSIFIINSQSACDVEQVEDLNNINKVKVVTQLRLEDNKVIADVDFINMTNKSVAIPFLHLFYQELNNDYFDIENDSNVKAEFNGRNILFYKNDKTYYTILRKGGKLKRTIVLNDYYSFPKTKKFYTVKYDNPYYGDSNTVRIDIR